MIKIFLLSFFLTVSHFESSPPEILVKVVVEAKNSNIKSRILSKFQTELRAKHKVSISSTNPDFIISVNAVEVQNSDNKTIGVVLSTVCTKKVLTHDNKIAYDMLINISQSINISEIEAKCVELASKFDVDYFETVR